jgi:hypothetical protein
MTGILLAATFWTWIWWVVGIFLWVLFIYFTFMLAASKGRSPLLWVILAIFFPLITIIVLLIIPSKSRPPV